jgi:anaerobic ribonucleoside-triphosphate reductase activating protein
MIGKIAKIATSFIDVPDEIAVAIYFAGCSIRCKGCQNPELLDSKSGKEMTIEEVLAKTSNHPLAKYVVFLGGEPTDQMDFLIELCRKLKNLKKAMYTGREFENLPLSLTTLLDYVVCGPYRIDLSTGGRIASSNQREFRKENGIWNCLRA